MSLCVSPTESVVPIALYSALSLGGVPFQAKLSGGLDEVDSKGNVTFFILILRAVQYRGNMYSPCVCITTSSIHYTVVTVYGSQLSAPLLKVTWHVYITLDCTL